jgi:hypothetical protein
VQYVALSSGTTSGTTKHIPVTASILKSNRKAALTALSWFQATYPEARLFGGQMFFVGGSTDLQPLRSTGPGSRRAALQEQVYAGDLSGIVADDVSPFLRPFTFPPRELALNPDWDEKIDELAIRSAHLPITLVSGVPSWLLVLFERLFKMTGKRKVTQVWPSLQLVVHGGTRFDPYRELFKEVVGGNVKFLETYPASEGFVAAEDPRYGLLRLIPDHGVFFEFVPVAELNSARPARHTLFDIQPGIQYAVVLTTPAGLWSYVLGDTICFESRDPPLLRFTGRTKQFLSAFGEHLIGEEVERAVAIAAHRANLAVVDFHAGPVFPENQGSPGRHRFFAEFTRTPVGVADFAAELDRALHELNDDYRAHRHGDLTLLAPEIVCVPRGGFADWLHAQGRVGGQHKVPRLDNTGRITQELSERFAGQGVGILFQPAAVR